MKYAIYDNNGVLEIREDSTYPLPNGAKLVTPEFESVIYSFPVQSGAVIRGIFDSLV